MNAVQRTLAFFVVYGALASLLYVLTIAVVGGAVQSPPVGPIGPLGLAVLWLVLVGFAIVHGQTLAMREVRADAERDGASLPGV
jgi:hypothetical protein